MKTTSLVSEQYDSNIHTILNADDLLSYHTICEVLNDCFGTNYTAWMRAVWHPKEQTFSVWFPKLAETKNGRPVPAAFDCLNIICEDWNTLIFDDMKKDRYNGNPVPYKHAGEDSPCLVFAKEPHGGPYIFRGVYIYDPVASSYMHSVNKRIAGKVGLTGHPVESIRLLDSI